MIMKLLKRNDLTQVVDMDIGSNMIGFSCPEEKKTTDALIDLVDEILILENNNGALYA